MDHRRATWRRVVGALLVQAVLVPTGLAQKGLAQGVSNEVAAPAFQPPTATSRIRRLLKQREALVTDEAWDQVIDLTEELQFDFGDEWFDSRPRYETVANYCQRLFLSAPPEGLATYRSRVDSVAERWLREGIEQLDESLLRRVTDELLASSYGDDALLALGELALERGDTAAARRYWRRIDPRLWGPRGEPIGVALADLDPKASPERLAKVWNAFPRPEDLLVYPDSDVPIADVLVRLAVASLREQDTARATLELRLLEALAPEASGRLAGRVQPYAKALAAMIEAASSVSSKNSERLDSLDVWVWPEAVTASRANLNAQQQLNRHLAARQQMRQRQLLLNRQALLRQRGIAVGGRWAIPPAPLPTPPPMAAVASAKQVVFVDAKGLRKIDVATGKASAIRLPGDPAPKENPAGPALPVAGQQGGNRIVLNGGKVVLRGGVRIQGGQIQWFGGQQQVGRRNPLSQPQVLPQALAIAGDLLYAVRSEMVTKRTERRILRVRQETLVGLDLTSDAKLVLEIKAEEIEKGQTFRFGGPPVIRGDRLYLLLTDHETLARLSVACFSRDNGRLIWRTPIGTGQPLVRGGGARRSITLAGDTVYVATNLGAVVALEVATGRLRWLAPYERLPMTAMRISREASPCVVQGDRLFVAPTDSPNLMALDTVAGRRLWTAKKPEGDLSVVGVVEKSLVLAGHRVASYGAATGREQFVWPESDHAGIRGKGHALIAGREIFWPTGDRVFILNPTTGRFTRPPIDLEPLGNEGANLFLAGQQLVVAGPEKINLRGPIPLLQKEPGPGLSRLSREAFAASRDDLLVIHSGR